MLDRCITEVTEELRAGSEKVIRTYDQLFEFYPGTPPGTHSRPLNPVDLHALRATASAAGLALEAFPADHPIGIQFSFPKD